MNNKKILIIDDEKDMLENCSRMLERSGYHCLTMDNPVAALELAANEHPDLVITDLKMPQMDGMDILREMKHIDPSILVIIFTAYADVPTAVEAMKSGAFDYIKKPFSLDEFVLSVKRAFQVKELSEDNKRMRRDLSTCYGPSHIIGESERMQNIYELVEQVSKTDSTVLILGENGTGKELIASAIHYQSTRRNEPLIRVNCAAFPENLVESELFGYEKGAFSGAITKKPGRFERADKGTIFLDEIGELPPSVQIKLLRVLQDGSFERLGGTRALNVDVRVIAATNRNLEEDIKSGRFREDLFYRLNVIPVHMPALRDRIEDIPLLVEHFIDIYNCKFGRNAEITTDAIRALMNYDFPGNVRELSNILERCITLLSNDLITVEDLPSHIVKNKNNPIDDTLSEVTAEAEKAHIVRILKSTKGNKTKAAQILGISRKSLWEKIKAYKIEN